MTTLYRTSTAVPTALAAACTSTATSISVGTLTGYPTSYPFKILVDWGSFTSGAYQEAMYVTAVSGTGPYTLTVTRGVDGTAASAHLQDAVVVHGVSAEDFNVSVTLDPVATDIQPDGVQSAGAHGLAADSGHIHPEQGWKTLLEAPTGAKGETFPRVLCSGTGGALGSGDAYLSAIVIPAGVTVSNITAIVVNAASGQTHGWYALTDDTFTVVAVSADQTTTVFTPAQAAVTLAMTASYTTTYTGMYYIVISQVATSPASFAYRGIISGAVDASPVLAGLMTIQSTPPAIGTTLSFSTGIGSCFYGYVS